MCLPGACTVAGLRDDGGTTWTGLRCTIGAGVDGNNFSKQVKVTAVFLEENFEKQNQILPLFIKGYNVQLPLILSTRPKILPTHGLISLCQATVFIKGTLPNLCQFLNFTIICKYSKDSTAMKADAFWMSTFIFYTRQALQFACCNRKLYSASN